MGTPQLIDELHTLTKYQPSYAGMPAIGNDACLVAESLDFTTLGSLTGGTQTTTLTRKPAGSTATVASNAFTADLAGLYTVTVALGGATRTYNVYAFPSAFVTTRCNPDGSGISSPSKFLTRNHLRNFVFAGVSTASLTTLETASPAPNMGMLGAIHSSAMLQGG